MFLRNSPLKFKIGLKVGDKVLQANGYDFTMVKMKQAERRIQRNDILRLKVTRYGLNINQGWSSSNVL